MPAPTTPTGPLTVTPPSRYHHRWLARLGRTPSVPPGEALGLADGDRLVVVVAHPDDETLAMGATLARLVADGVAVHLLTLTRGEAALDHVGRRVAGLADRRTSELAAAAGALGLTTSRQLALPDSALSEHHDEARSAVADLVTDRGATALATLWHRDPHPDHRAASGAALAVADGIGLPVHELGLWSTHWTDPDLVTDTVVPLAAGGAAAAARADALACYGSQLQPLAPDLAAVLPATVHTWTHEYLVRP